MKKFEFDRSEVERLRGVDARISALVDFVGEIDREYIPDPFLALVNSIVYQQLAYAAANTIWRRVESFIEITPENILAADRQALRGLGLSSRKVEYIRCIAEAALEHALDAETLSRKSDAEVVESLVKIKGVGEWTAEMFLIFSLARRDVLSYSDLGLRKGIQWLYSLREEPSRAEFERCRRCFSPDNTLAAMYLWEITIRKLFRFKDIFEAARSSEEKYK